MAERARSTYHLVPESTWRAADPSQPYTPAGFEAEGFIHCTDGERELIATANRYYRQQPGPFLAIEIDTALVRAPIKDEDTRRIYPHLYGALNRDAVVAVHRVERDRDGTFLALAPSDEATHDTGPS